MNISFKNNMTGLIYVYFVEHALLVLGPTKTYFCNKITGNFTY